VTALLAVVSLGLSARPVTRLGQRGVLLVGGGAGLAMPALATARTNALLAAGQATAPALTGGYHLRPEYHRGVVTCGPLTCAPMTSCPGPGKKVHQGKLTDPAMNVPAQ
jgi:hypothetical protein